MKILAACSAAALLAVSACTGSGAVDQSAGGQFRYHVANSVGKTIAVAERKKVAGFTGKLLSGGTYSLAQDAGKIVVLSFWAQWCPPCQVEAPQYDLLYRHNKGRGIDFVGIDTKDIASAARAFVSENHISFRNVYDEPGEIALRLGNLPAQGLPFTVLIDKQQRVAAVYLGPQSPKDLQPVLDRLAGEPER
jgi:peroxiredoxin